MTRSFAVASAALFGMMYSMSAMALGTAADTDIDNFATVDFQVSGTPQVTVTSNTTSFKVDQVVDLTVAEADGGETSVVPNQQDAVARFTVTNTGNEVQDFGLSVNDVVTGVFGITDNFDPSAFTIVVDTNNNDVYDAGVDTVQSFIDELSPNVTADPATDNVISVFVLADIPLVQVTGDGANIELVAEAREGGVAGQGIVQAETGGNNTDGLEIVWSNNTASDDDAYSVGAIASLAAAKTSEVLSDPLGNSAPAAVAIPGAIVEYTITITNSGSVAATDVTVTDTLQADLSFETGNYDVGVSDSDVQVDALGVTSYCIAEAGGTDTNADGCVRTGTVLSVGAAGMTADTAANAPNNVVTVRFQVAIN